MKTVYKLCFLLLALGGWEKSFASGGGSNPPPPPPPPTISSVSVFGTASFSSVCANVPFTATANVANEVSGLSYSWGVAIGTVNGVPDFVTTTSKSVTCVVLRPPGSTNISRVSVNLIRNGVMVSSGIRDLTVQPNVVPAQPSFISLQADNGLGAPCQFGGGSFSVPGVFGAYQYEWEFEGSFFVTESPSLFVWFNNADSQTITVRARGCAGTSPDQSTSYFVIPASQSPCNQGPILQQALTVSPNPATTEFTLTTSEDYASSPAQLSNQKTGKVEKSFTITGTSMKVDIRELPAGIYLLTVDGKKDKATKRIMVNK